MGMEEFHLIYNNGQNDNESSEEDTIGLESKALGNSICQQKVYKTFFLQVQHDCIALVDTPRL